MAQLQQLKVFVNERLRAAAEEILGAVERTILEYQTDIYLSKQDKHNELLTLADCAKRKEVDEFIAVSQEVSRSEAEASTQPSHTEDPQELGSSQDKRKLQDLSDDDDVAVVCLKHGQSTQTPSYCQTQTVATGEEVLPSGTSTEWMRTEEEADGCGGSDCWQPLSTGSGHGVDSSDPEWMESGGSDPYSKTKTSNKRQRQNSSLTKHVKSHANNAAIVCPPNHAASAERGTEPSETHREDNLCYICGKTFTTRSHLKRHLLVHTGQKPHCCEECGKRFARGECLRIHMRIHTVEKPYTCEVCGKGFKQRSNMICHIRTHTGEKLHRCVICSRTFAYKQDMIRHMQGHAKM